MRLLLIVIAIVLGLVGLAFLAGRGGHETYDAKYFKPGPVIGLVKGLSDDNLQGRAIGTEGSARAQEMIEARMSALELLKLGQSGYRHPFTIENDDGAMVDGVNLIGAIQGSEGSDRVIVITAHYDHLGIQDGEIYNGADDNASGVAALFAIAEHFSGKKNTPRHSLLFVVLDGEERGFLGARAFMNDPTVSVQDIAFNLNLDMVARADNGTLWASGGAHTAALLPLLEAVSEDAPLTLRTGFDDSDESQDDWTEMSDHAVFYQAGIPHLYLGVEDHPDYHKPTDDFEKIDQDVFLKSVDTILLVTMALDEQLDDILATPETGSDET